MNIPTNKKHQHGTKGKDVTGGADSVKSPGKLPETSELPPLHKNHDMTSHVPGHGGGSHCPEDFSS